MNQLVLFALAGSSIGLMLALLALLFVIRVLNKLRKDNLELARTLAQQKNDIVGLCSAAIAVDRRLGEYDDRLSDLLTCVERIRNQKEVHNSYYQAIEKIKKGASKEEIVSECGFSVAEAALLLRLHRASGVGIRGHADSR
jgi:transcriptional regulator GlxA family with amidase domain